eukprot:TRINITY_DN33777_c0_g1_i2.p1 TRINITY_DN33777_c0_g1~~TRINITY_DN33777_c0_g1_i2.p1  ORF type:complete len:178 (-),score=11.98 TRINITY_DN33777_c0_g1_i2:461-994(-)
MNEVVTSDPASSSHILQDTWVWWYSQSTDKWDPKEMTSISNVREFWSIFNNLVSPSYLPHGSDYFVFKKGIDPAWEHEANRDGCQCSLEFTRKESDEQLIDNCWMWTLLALIGDYFQDSTEINGVIISSRPRYVRISLWLRSVDAKDRVGSEWRSNLNIPDKIRFVIKSLRPREEAS